MHGNFSLKILEGDVNFRRSLPTSPLYNGFWATSLIRDVVNCCRGTLPPFTSPCTRMLRIHSITKRHKYNEKTCWSKAYIPTYSRAQASWRFKDFLVFIVPMKHRNHAVIIRMIPAFCCNHHSNEILELFCKDFFVTLGDLWTNNCSFLYENLHCRSPYLKRIKKGGEMAIFQWSILALWGLL